MKISVKQLTQALAEVRLEGYREGVTDGRKLAQEKEHIQINRLQREIISLRKELQDARVLKCDDPGMHR